MTITTLLGASAAGPVTADTGDWVHHRIRAHGAPKAFGFPVELLAANVQELPNDVEVVAYCRGRYCVFADDAVRLLRRRGLLPA